MLGRVPAAQGGEVEPFVRLDEVERRALPGRIDQTQAIKIFRMRLRRADRGVETLNFDV